MGEGKKIGTMWAWLLLTGSLILIAGYAYIKPVPSANGNFNMQTMLVLVSFLVYVLASIFIDKNMFSINTKEDLDAFKETQNVAEMINHQSVYFNTNLAAAAGFGILYVIKVKSNGAGGVL
mgnify:FL=1